MKAENITKSFGEKKVLDGFSFEFPEKKCTVITGRSGCGKTTLLRILSGLEEADGGSVSPADGKRSYIFQENRLLEHSRVIDNILAVAPDRKRAEYFLAETGLSAEKNTRTSKLSGGMKRRLSLARCLACGGDVFFLDEPLRELDGETLEKMMRLLKKETAGKTVIMIAHDEKQIEYFADVVCRL